MRWLVTGASGMLGSDAADLLRRRGHDVTAASRAELDVTSLESTRDAIRGHDVVLNCAAWTAVDDAEDREGEAFLVNAVGPATLATAAREADALLVTVSTDYVFDGSATTPYWTDHQMRPVSAYGRTKAAGEWAVRAESPNHLILRTAWLYGAGGGCFPKTIARVAAERGSVSVVADQHGQPTWTRDVADLAERLVMAGVTGTHHATAGGETTWFGFAEEACRAAGLPDGTVTPTTSDQFVRPAPRPAYSVLSHESLVAAGVEPIGDWRERWLVAATEVLG